jgi:integral membrane protein
MSLLYKAHCGMTSEKMAACIAAACISRDRAYPYRAFTIMISLSTSIGRVRLVGIIEGISYLLLLGVAMPLKYMADMPQAVSIVGMAHGLLFVLFCLVLLLAWLGEHLSFRLAALAFLATLFPFGPWLIDRKLAALEKP